MAPAFSTLPAIPNAVLADAGVSELPEHEMLLT